MDERDRERILRYGESVLAREPHNLQLTEFVTRALLDPIYHAGSRDGEYARRGPLIA